MPDLDASVHTSVVSPPHFSTVKPASKASEKALMILPFRPGSQRAEMAPVIDESWQSHFASTAPALVAKGWSVFPQERDKSRKPGSVRGTAIGWKNVHELHLRPPGMDVLKRWTMHCPGLNAACVLGVGSGNTFAIDVDVLDAAMSSRITEIAFGMLGATPLRRVGMAPKIALIYRHGPDETLLYARKIFQQLSQSGDTNGIEILCGGRPLTFTGLHWKTGGHFKWTKANPMLTGPEECPLVTSEQVEAFLAAVDAEFPFKASALSFTPGATGGTWGEASGEIRIPRPDNDGVVAHGREDALLRFSAKLVKANGKGVIAAEAADQVREFSEHLAGVCADQFGKIAVVGDAKWPLHRVLSESRTKVASAVRKVISGAFQPTARDEPITERMAPTPAFRLADVPLVEGAPTILLGVGDSYTTDEAVIVVNRADGTTEEYNVGTVKVEIDYAAREAARAADLAIVAARREARKSMPRPESDRPLIRLDKGSTEQVVDAVERALIASDRGLYQRGGMLVAIGEQPVMTSEGEIRGLQVYEQKEFALLEAMSSVAHYEKWDGRKHGYAATDVPMLIAKTFQQRVGRWNLPLLTGLATAPTLRSDGSILDTEGYDRRTGLVVDYGFVEFPKFPEHPTKQDAAAALGVLKGLVSTFPFVSEVHRSVALSCLLTATIRRSLRTAPLHAFSAPVAGSGKSKLSDIASVLATGREAAVISQGASEEEFEKRLGAALLAGESVLSIDNCTLPVGGKFLCSALTSTVVSTRILGKSEAPKIQTDALMTVNGNNLTLLEDMDRRFLLSKLDPACELPQLREFSFDPVAVAKARRPEFVVAALTVLRAYKLTNRVCKLTELGSFGEWSAWVREALVWLGEADPVDVSETAALDIARDSLTAVLVQWFAAVGTRKLSVRDLIQEATEVDHSTSYNGRTEFLHPDFREALIAVAGEGGAVNTRRLAKFLGARSDRIVGGLSIRKAGISAGIQMWALDGPAAA